MIDSSPSDEEEEEEEEDKDNVLGIEDG